MNILITGGCGFIGSNLVKRAATLGWHIDVVDDMSSGTLDLLYDLPNDYRIRVIPSGSLLPVYEEQEEKRLPNDVMIL